METLAGLIARQSARRIPEGVIQRTVNYGGGSLLDIIDFRTK
jgi:hypothetical protein